MDRPILAGTSSSLESAGPRVNSKCEGWGGSNVPPQVTAGDRTVMIACIASSWRMLRVSSVPFGKDLGEISTAVPEA